jgi:RNA polymerase sigma-70 factor, ECF subfamily
VCLCASADGQQGWNGDSSPRRFFVSTSTPDADRFNALYRSTRKDVLAYLARRAHGHDEAADLLAETYLIAWRKLDQVPKDEQGRLWLFGVARNLLKKQARHHHLQDELTKRLEQELRATAPSPTLSDGPWSDKLRQAISDLPEKEREILLLTAWEGLAPREIAAIIGSSANAVRVRLARARSRLRPELTASTNPICTTTQPPRI